MKVAFEATLDDFVDVNARVMNHSKATRSFNKWTMVLFALVFGLPVAIGSQASLPANLIKGVLGAVLFLLLFTALHFLFRPLNKWRIRRFYREQIGADGPITVEVEITEGGVLVRQLETETSFAWSTVVGIAEKDYAIEVWRPGGVLVVRDRAFVSSEERAEFLSLCKEWSTHSKEARDA